jgi:dihydrofolate reductase
MNISIIVAIGENRELGLSNKLIWSLPDDLRRFREITMGHCVLMGRKTYESIGKPLPNRENVILTHDKSYEVPNCKVIHSVAEALEIFPECPGEIFIIGGGEMYKLFLPYANNIYLTQVEAKLEADTFFPELDPKTWKLVSEELHPKDEKHIYNFSFRKYQRV